MVALHLLLWVSGHILCPEVVVKVTSSLRSTGMFVLVYAFFYFMKRSHMYGTLQTVEFFGYTLLSCYVFFLMLGTVSFLSSLTFVRYIYRNLKMD